MVHCVLLGAGVLLGAAVVLLRTHAAVITHSPEHFAHFYGGNIHGVGDFVGWMLVWGLGVPTESYYLHRFYASRDARVARMQVGIGGHDADNMLCICDRRLRVEKRGRDSVS
jgi:hypothetical protein